VDGARARYIGDGMKLQEQPPVHLTYGLSIHPDETLAQLENSIRHKARAVRDRVAPGRPFGLGLRISDAVSRELAEGDALPRLKALLDEHGFYVFTINGFPFGRFRGGPVKERVYAPDWRTDERVVYTMRLADQLAQLLPEGMTGSISTVPGSFRSWVRTDADLELIADRLSAAAAHLAGIRDRTGREIHLGLEPEPGCLWETPAELVLFMREHLWTADRAGERARRHVGACLDTCHMALCFEEPEDVLAVYRNAGVRVSKIQLSAALESDGADVQALGRFAEPVYLHQAAARWPDGRRRSWPDLPGALRDLAGGPPPRTVRVHFHVPLPFGGGAGLRSTAALLRPSFFRALRSGAAEHLEIETYSFDALPDGSAGDVVDSVAGEYRWTLARWADAGPPT